MGAGPFRTANGPFSDPSGPRANRKFTVNYGLACAAAGPNAA